MRRRAPRPGRALRLLKCPPTTPGNWFSRHKVLTGVLAGLALLLIGIGIGAGGGNDEVATPTVADASSPATPDESSSEPAPSPTKTSAAPKEPAEPKNVKYSGRGDKVLKIRSQRMAPT
jgi:hypothetical protein